MPDPVLRNTLETVEYSTDYADVGYDYDAATWEDIPVGLIRQNESQPARETRQEQNLINGIPAGAGKVNVGIFPVIIRDSDTFLDTAKSAEATLTPVWVAVKPRGINRRIIGGLQGCIVSVDEDAFGAFGDFGVALFVYATAGNVAGDTFEVITGSGS